MSKLPLQLRPGILVGLKSEIRGGVHYKSVDLPTEASTAAVDMVAPNTAKVEVYKTTKVTDDPKDHEAALKARNAARDEITKLCVLTPFGLVCPKDNENKLDEAIAASEQIARDHNAKARHSFVAVDCIKGYIADNNEKAARSIANAIADSVADMRAGLEKRDAEMIRGAVRKAQKLGEMIDADASAKVSEAIAVARAAAKEIVATIKKRGDAACLLVADSNKKILDAMAKNFTVLDLAAPAPIVAADAIAPAAVAELDLPDLGDEPVIVPPSASEAPVPLLDLPSDDDSAPAVALGDVDASAAVDGDASGYGNGESMAAAPSDGAPLEF